MTDITYSDMVRKLFKDPSTIKLDDSQINLLHAAVGLAGEAGEVLFCVIDTPTYGLKEMPEVLIGELGDMEFYLEAFRQAFGAKYEECAPNEGVWAAMSPTYYAANISVSASGVLDDVKKMVFNNREGLRPQVLNKLNIIYLFTRMLCKELGITRDQALRANMDKLGARYDGFNYSDEAAAARRDEG